MGIETPTKQGTTLDCWGRAQLRENDEWRGWENPLKAIVIQWKVFGGLGVTVR
jgi:hypothetical protein